MRASRRHLGDRVRARRDDEVTANDEIGAAGIDARGRQCACTGRELHVRHDRAVLLREAGHVEHRYAFAFEMRRHGEDLADGDHAGAADSGDEHAVLTGKLAHSRSSRCTASSSSRWRMVTPGAQLVPCGYLSGSSVTTIIGLTPSAAICREIIAGSSGPSWRWPPVIATASL